MHIIVNKKVSVVATAALINVMVLKEKIQKAIWEENPNVSEVLGIQMEGIYHIYILMNESKQYPYTRLTIEY